MIDSLKIVFKNNFVLNLFKSFSENFNVIDLLKHILATNGVNCRSYFTGDRKWPSFASK